MTSPIFPGTTAVVGPSSVGKSQYIHNLIRNGHLEAEDVKFAFEYDCSHLEVEKSGRLIHFNMLAPFENRAEEFFRSIDQCFPARQVFLDIAPKQIIVLVAPKRVILKRALTRRFLEAELRNSLSPYPKKQIFDFYSRVNLADVYAKWNDFLESHHLPVKFVSTIDSNYSTIQTYSQAMSILNDDSIISYSDDERKQALDGFEFSYHKVSGFGDVTGDGQDRSDTLAAIMPYLLPGSVLDVGCGIGSFCFELERRGFGPVTGTEIKKERFLAACALKEVTQSNCTFEYTNLLAEESGASADTVLLLNVIHHLIDPIGGLRRAAGMANRTLILEYPTLSDPKFQETLSSRPFYFEPNLPLIGVSRMSDQDQTFVYSDEALRRILLENNRLFSRIDFLQSPMADSRRIAICHK